MAGGGRIFIKYILDFLSKSWHALAMMINIEERIVTDPPARLLKAVLERAVLDITEPNQYVTDEDTYTAKKLISSCVLDEMIESSNLDLCASVVRNRLRIPRDKTSDLDYGEKPSEEVSGHI